LYLDKERHSKFLQLEQQSLEHSKRIQLYQYDRDPMSQDEIAYGSEESNLLLQQHL
jgi:hypothetical protein